MTNTKFEFRILNNTGFAPEQIWLVGKGQSLDAPPAPAPALEAFFNIASNGQVDLTKPDENALSAGFSIQLSAINRVDGKEYYSLFLPPSQGCRIYISIGRPVTLLARRSNGITIIDPDPWKSSDPNFALVYDKVEFSLTDMMYVDTTAVDFFGIPISLTANSMLENQESTGLPQSRTTILDTYKERLTGAWKKLLLNYPPGSAEPTAILRVVAPNKAVGNLWSKKKSPPSPEENTESNFDRNYLDAYLTSIWSNDQVKLQVDCSEIDKGIYQGTMANGQLNFVSTTDSTDNFSIAKPASIEAFGGEGGSFHAEAKTPRVLCIRALTVAINTGLMPITDNALLNHAYFTSRGADFYNNPDAALNPNFNLYSKVTHAIPEDGKPYPNPVSNKMYAFAYDDAAGQDGLLKVEIKPNAFVCVNLKSLGGLKLPDPDHDDKNTYKVTFSAPAPPKDVNPEQSPWGYGQLLDKNKAVVATFPSNSTVEGLSSPFTIKYGPTKKGFIDYKVYVALQAIFDKDGESLDGVFVCLDGNNSYQINFPKLNG